MESEKLKNSLRRKYCCHATDTFFSLEVTLAKLVREMEIRRRDATL